MQMSNAPLATRLWGRAVLFAALAVGSLSSVHAVQFEVDIGDGLSGTLNTSATLGAAWRMQNRANDLVGKANLMPNLCGTRYVAVRDEEINFHSCQGINQNDVLPAQALSGIADDLGQGPIDGLGSRGQFSPNFDDGNWNYDRYDMVQAPFKVTQDLSLTYDDYGFFGRWLYFYDFVNNDFDEYHPNRLRPGDPGSEPPAIAGLPISSNTYGSAPGAHYSKRSDSAVLEQIGSDFQLMDAYFYGYFPFIGDRELSLKVGRQSISWGESTLLVINSLNQANPVDANNLFRTGFVPEEVFSPVGMIYASTGITDNLSIEAYYQYEWDNVVAQAPGGFYSAVDSGTNNAGGNTASISFGGPAEDPTRVGTPLNNPLSALTDASTTILRRPDNTPSDSGQFGIAFKYYAADFNNGTDFGFYFMNYHSKLPYASFWASELSCARTHPNDGANGDPTGANLGVDAANLPTLLLACPNLPLAEQLAAGNGALIPLDSLGLDQLVLDPVGGVIQNLSGTVLGPITDVTQDLGLPFDLSNGIQLLGTGPVTDAVPLDGVQFGLEYPEDLQLYGMSFNTTAGDLSFQGEIAYRPNMPVQVDLEDLTFAALGPTLTSCHRAVHPEYDGATCADATGVMSQSGPNTFNLIPATGGATGNGGDAPSVQRSFPSYITSYRGVTVGENDPRGYIRGWEHVKSLQYNLGATYILGKTANPIGADQVILFFEVGASQILNAPERWLYQIDSPGTHRHASAGVVDTDTVDPSDTSLSPQQIRQDHPGCITGICVAGTDGLRFNPQQETQKYASDFSWGYRIISLLRYESIAPGISLQPFIILAHDVEGISPGPGENFIEGRKNFSINFEIRYKNNWAFFPGYTWWTGGGSQNLMRDRDQAQFYVRYQF